VQIEEILLLAVCGAAGRADDFVALKEFALKEPMRVEA
jgi:hypothetical protein